MQKPIFNWTVSKRYKYYSGFDMKLYPIISSTDFFLNLFIFQLFGNHFPQQFLLKNKRKMNCEYLNMMIIIILVCRILDRIQYVTCLYVEEHNKINEWNAHWDFFFWSCIGILAQQRCVTVTCDILTTKVRNLRNFGMNILFGGSFSLFGEKWSLLGGPLSLKILRVWIAATPPKGQKFRLFIYPKWEKAKNLMYKQQRR